MTPSGHVECSGLAPIMKIATCNVDGTNGRLPRLLEWLAESRPDAALLQPASGKDKAGDHAPARGNLE